jgi:putative ABC transport system permease protein
MLTLLFAVITQALTFLPLAVGISISFTILRATDMTLDGSFVLGAAIFARLVTLGFSPSIAAVGALMAGLLAGSMTALIQRNGKVDPLLAGILASFILMSGNLIIMGRPNINLLTQPTLVSHAFSVSESTGWITVAAYSLMFCGAIFILMKSQLGLRLRAFGDNPVLLQRMGKNTEHYRIFGFALTNMAAAASGCLTAQTVGYADTGMGFGMTLTGIGAIILGQQVMHILLKKSLLRIAGEYIACFIGITLYFSAINLLLRFEVNPIYVKMLLGIILILFLRTATSQRKLV